MIKFGAPTVGLMGINSMRPLNDNYEVIPMHKVGFEDFAPFEEESGYLYVVARGISSRINANFDGWPVDEIRTAYRTFVGRPVYVEHNNTDPTRARGVILDAILRETKLGSGMIDSSVYLLLEIDSKTFPKLAQAIVDGKIGGVSMGADVEGTTCSVCHKYASTPKDYCSHIPGLKGRTVTIYKHGKRVEALVWENCHKPNFFEISAVFRPADESAKFLATKLVP
jgi:hypothetical protein